MNSERPGLPDGVRFTAFLPVRENGSRYRSNVDRRWKNSSALPRARVDFSRGRREERIYHTILRNNWPSLDIRRSILWRDL